MNARVFLAILCGCIIGGTFVYALAAESNWYWLGVPLGGTAAWVTYTWQDIRREAPIVWASVSSWRPDGERWKVRWEYMVSTLMLGAAITSNVLLLGLIFGGLSIISEDWFQYLLSFTGFVSVALASHDSLDDFGYKKGRRVSNRGIRFVAKRKRALIWRLSPIGISIMLVEVAIYLPQLVVLIGKFLIKLFIRVHSNDAFDALLYATVGVASAAAVTRSIWVILISAIVGVGLAFVFRNLARFLKTQWPSLA